MSEIETTASVTTAHGQVRGLRKAGVSVFKGLRYGADTAGAGRFRPPQPVTPWTGVQDAFDFGPQSPQMRSPLADKGPMSEDCLRLNIFTPAADAAARPVMVWFHGGGFEAGSGSQKLYDGTALALRGDVVVVTLNHRLNVFGHCYLGDRLGEAYAQAGNVGYLDLIAALRWVRDNIAAFGGDPTNVTVFGQSGGGRKVSLCYAGEDARGLFQRGIVQSGSHLRVQAPEEAARLTSALLAALDLGDAAQLLEVPMDALSVAQLKVMRETRSRFSPVLDGLAFKDHPFLPNAPAISNQLPMMVGTTRTELSNQLGYEPGAFELDMPELRKRLVRHVGEADVEAAIAEFRASNPAASPSELYFLITSARGYILDQTLMAEQRVKAGAAPTYVYQLTWRSPAEDGRRISQHTLDLPFMFDNVAAAPHLTGPQSNDTRALAEAMSETWLAFARTGDPNNAAIPAWAPYDLGGRPMMLFDVPPRLADDPFAGERAFMSRFPTQQMGRTLHRQ
ncbi:carboxylesterase family protein [Phenylobacterium sp. LjRoot164]|uniref:carboxylesterase/lipase family protein n=1 Tax=unclassified Phenylobacterium TaxID=2640670 RepID=UPI003ECFB2A3